MTREKVLDSPGFLKFMSLTAFKLKTQNENINSLFLFCKNKLYTLVTACMYYETYYNCLISFILAGSTRISKVAFNFKSSSVKSEQRLLLTMDILKIKLLILKDFAYFIKR